MTRKNIYRDPDRIGHSFTHGGILFRYVATHRENDVAFYCDLTATKGIAVYPSGRVGTVQNPCTTDTPNTKGSNGRRKQRYRYFRDAFGHHKGLMAAQASYIAERGELIPEGLVLDHIDGCTTNNHPSNLRAVTPAINSRDGGFLRKLRNRGIIVALFPGIILEGYARMAVWKATHTQQQYDCLTRDDLLRIFVGPTFTVIDPNILMDLDFKD